ncbi:MAG: CARDB domain-containing protein [Solirubrobacterales bacterium]
MRRLIAVAIFVLFAILLVIGFKGCLNARKERALKNFVTDTNSIMTESSQVGQDFFALLNNAGGKSDLEYKAQITSYRGAAENQYDRAKALDAPGEMSQAKSAVVLTLLLRRNALQVISDNISTALGKENAVEAQTTVSDQMKLLYASDADYAGAAVPEMTKVLEDQGLSGNDVTITAADKVAFVPEPREKWLEPATITAAFAQVTGSAAAAPGLHGVAILSAKIGDADLAPGTSVTVDTANPELVVDVENGGDSEESDVTVTASIGGTTLESTIAKIGAGQTTSVKMPITPLPPSGQQATVDVTVSPVPGETNTDNNNATYTVTF